MAGGIHGLPDAKVGLLHVVHVVRGQGDEAENDLVLFLLPMAADAVVASLITIQ